MIPLTWHLVSHHRIESQASRLLLLLLLLGHGRERLGRRARRPWRSQSQVGHGLRQTLTWWANWTWLVHHLAKVCQRVELEEIFSFKGPIKIFLRASQL